MNGPRSPDAVSDSIVLKKGSLKWACFFHLLLGYKTLTENGTLQFTDKGSWVLENNTFSEWTKILICCLWLHGFASRYPEIGLLPSSFARLQNIDRKWYFTVHRQRKLGVRTQNIQLMDQDPHMLFVTPWFWIEVSWNWSAAFIFCSVTKHSQKMELYSSQTREVGC